MRQFFALLLPILLTTSLGCSASRGTAVDDAGSTAEDAGSEDVDAGPDGGCNELDPNCPCRTNFHRCGGVGRCRFDQDPDFCGASCTVCPNDDYTVGACDGTQCQVTCKNGGHLCGDHCEPETGDSCGPNCIQCPTAVNGAPVCVSGQCAISCANDFSTCGDGRCGAAPNGSCTADADCCRGKCGNDAVCCAIAGTTCNNMADCNGCFAGDALQCVSNHCCVPVAHACTTAAECCSGRCDTVLSHTCVGP